MYGKAAAIALALLLVSPAAADASGWRFDDRGSHPRRHHDSHSGWSQWVGSHDDEDSDEDSDSDEPESSDEPATAGGTVLDGTAKTVTAQLTGYSYFDNTPPGSADICCPKLHQKAGGAGTYVDPITTAVPGSGGQGMETPAGTRLYVAKLKRYFIVEDSGASGSGYRFDLWVGGQGFDESSSEQCMSEVTGDAQAILNPAAGLPVTVGPLTSSSGCKV